MQLSSIHPFPDSNGRTVRLAINGILQSHGYPPVGLEPEHIKHIFPPDSTSVVSLSGTTEQDYTQGVERSLSVAQAQVRR
jgi:Fic family protein